MKANNNLKALRWTNAKQTTKRMLSKKNDVERASTFVHIPIPLVEFDHSNFFEEEIKEVKLKPRKIYI